jgi:hypothetical protein
VYSVLDNVCIALLIASAPTLLAFKFFWQKRVPWWLVILSVVALSTAIGVVHDRIGARAHFERFDACVEKTPIDYASAPGVAEAVFPPSCGPIFYHVATPPIYLKWIPGVGLLALSLPFYGLAIWLRARRSRIAAA